MTEHTPGEWVASKGTEDEDERWLVVTEGRLGFHIAEIQNGAPGDTLQTEAANARLIAAAPEMLTALRKAEQFIVNGIEWGYIRMPDADTPDSALDTLPAIRAAIKKATSE